ncbi:hypothetical protein QVD17_04544 [Tagetes erecta]|uniref:Uncharacterized protein n=1 Tax=Tagetes erecta TaxID=13708 RepID=A0AAD8LAC2_TARER|nr:hypothetical protein QVD17_04544 [Tagetes erecta]
MQIKSSQKQKAIAILEDDTQLIALNSQIPSGITIQEPGMKKQHQNQAIQHVASATITEAAAPKKAKTDYNVAPATTKK